MPQWRKVHKKVTVSQDWNEMPDEFTMLLWLLLPHAVDREGRGIYNANYIKAQILPLRDDATPGKIHAAMEWFRGRRMIEVYPDNGREYFWIPTFHKYQGNCDREAESTFPPAPGELVEHEPRPTHDQLKSKSGLDSEEKRRDADVDAEDAAGDLAPFEQVFCKETGLPPLSGGPERWFAGLKQIKDLGATPEDFRQAIREQIAAKKTGRSYNCNSPSSFVNATSNIIAAKNGQAPAASKKTPERVATEVWQ